MNTEKFKYDIAISFAGEDREVAEAIATRLHEMGVVVFYDRFNKAHLWGKNLIEYLADVYGTKSRFCLMIISKQYPLKEWPKHERHSAQERQMRDPNEYILPLRIDDTRIPGFPSTIGFLDWESENLNSVCNALIEKLKRSPEGGTANGQLPLHDQIADATVRLKYWSSSYVQRRNALKSLGLLSRQTVSTSEKRKISSVVVLALFDANKKLRDMAASILGEIGPAAIDVLLAQETWKIPGRTHGYDVAKRIFVSMGKPAVDTLLASIDKDVYVITNVLNEMSFEHTKDACIEIFKRDEFSGRYREEIINRMRSKGDWEESELRSLLELGLKHVDPLVRILSAEWFTDAFPKELSETLASLLDDPAKVEKFYGPVEVKSVSEWIQPLLNKEVD